MTMKMVILLAPLFFLCSSVLGQELLQILTLHCHDLSSVASIPKIAVSVDEEKLNEVSNSVLMAEKWLRIHVLSRYPSNNIKSIVITNNLLCNEEKIKNREEIAGLTLRSMKNMYYSLTRWGLENEIKVSVSISSNCFHQSHLKPVFRFLKEINSTYTINSPQFSDEIAKLLISELKSMNELGIFQSEMADVIFPVSKQSKKPKSRKLSFIDPLWWSATPPSQVSYTFSPLTGVPSLAPPRPFAPEIQPPMTSPASSPSLHYGFDLPPCNPYPRPRQAPPPIVGNTGRSMAVPPASGGGYGREELWCVAKPSVPSEKLQEAMDYACGAGGADCGAINPTGSCYSPDSVVAHASHAFNSYWQKNKKNGGVCGFDGTAMLISSDPSFLHCHFILG